MILCQKSKCVLQASTSSISHHISKSFHHESYLHLRVAFKHKASKAKAAQKPRQSARSSTTSPVTGAQRQQPPPNASTSTSQKPAISSSSTSSPSESPTPPFPPEILSHYLRFESCRATVIQELQRINGTTLDYGSKAYFLRNLRVWPANEYISRTAKGDTRGQIFVDLLESATNCHESCKRFLSENRLWKKGESVDREMVRQVRELGDKVLSDTCLLFWKEVIVAGLVPGLVVGFVGYVGYHLIFGG